MLVFLADRSLYETIRLYENINSMTNSTDYWSANADYL